MAGHTSTILILTNSKDATADYLVTILRRHGQRLVRWDTDSLVDRIRVAYSIGAPTVFWDGHWYRPEDFTVVWNRRPERLKHSPLEAMPEGRFILDEWSEALEGFLSHIAPARWVNHPSSNAMAAHKLGQLTIARTLGFAVPDTLVTQESEELREFYGRHSGTIIVKPLSRGYVERTGNEADSLIFTNRVLEEHLANLDDLSSCPTLFQEFIPKLADIRLTVVDADYHPVELKAEDDGVQRCDIRRDNMQDVRYQEISLPDEVYSRVRMLMGHYRLRFGAIDFAVANDGRWYFLEINPNGQWAWMDLEGASNIASSFVTGRLETMPSPGFPDSLPLWYGYHKDQATSLPH